MEIRFTKLWNRIGAKGSPKEEYAKLFSMYSEAGRFYHNFEHIKNCLTEFDSVRHLIPQPDLVELAIWYHDVIYNPKAKENEERSAQFAYDVCIHTKLTKEFGEKFKELILTTKHNTIPKEMESKFLVDIDLSTLGKPLKEFNKYSSDIRKEYSFSTEDIYRNGRKKILQAFLDKDSIYLTDFFRDKYELQARNNIASELAII